MLRVLLTTLAIAGTVAGQAAEPGRPNFLLIVADDLCWRDLGCTGGKNVKTPHLDSLARDGLRLAGMFSPAATCSPTRHALYTGLFPVRSGAYPNHTTVDEGTRSIFGYLKDLGYDVALHGKEHVHPKSSFPYEHLGNEKNGGCRRAVEFIRGRKPGSAGKPWFLTVASNEPHSPWTLGPHVDPTTIVVPPYLHDNVATRERLAKYYGEVAALDGQVGALLEALDDSRQAENTLVLFVSEQGCSLPYGGKWSLYDTGIRAAALARWPGKIRPGTLSEALVQYVDVPPTLLALAGGDPTRIDTGCPDADGRKGFDGRDFREVLFGRAERFRDRIFAQHTTVGVNGFKEPYPSRAVRDARWKLIRNLLPENRFEIDGIHKGEPLASWKADAAADPRLAARIEGLFRRPAEELYDLTADEFELRNLADDPNFAEIRRRLGADLDAWMRQQGDRGPETELRAKSRQPRGKERD